MTLRLLALAVGFATLWGCSSPKYTFHFKNEPARYADTPKPSETTEPVVLASTSNQPVVPTVEEKAKEIEQKTSELKARAEQLQHKEQFASSKEYRTAKKELKKDVKYVLKDIKKYSSTVSKASPEGTEAGDKSQLVALLLGIFLGGLGVHRFYLGYIGIGIAQLLMIILSPFTLFISAAVAFIWILIDIIRIATGDLKPKNGEYTDTL